MKPGQIIATKENGSPYMNNWDIAKGTSVAMYNNGFQIASCVKKYQNDPKHYAPPVAEISNGHGTHFVVVTGINKNGSYQVVDPVNKKTTTYSGPIHEIRQYSKK